MLENFHHQQLMYGTADGSVGTLFRLPQLCFYLLNMLQQTMDKMVCQDLTLVKRSDYRQVQGIAVE